MRSINMDKIFRFVDRNIGSFHSSKLDAITELKLSMLLKRKNPYLFKAKKTAEEFVRNLLDAYLSSQEETMFGNFLEKLAIFVCKEAFVSNKAPAEGIDLDFTREGKSYLQNIRK